MQFRKIAIIGVGLLGGSLGLAARKRRLANEVAGFVRRRSSIAECKRLGAVDFATQDLNGAVRDADLVVLCTPLSKMRALVQQMIPALKDGAIVTDVGSVKASVVRDICGLVRKSGAHFVGSHPMAGNEKTGVAAAHAGLFENAVCVLTPTKNSNRAAARKLELFWKSLGARTLKMPPRQHDFFVSRTSHLPHVTAAALASVVLNPSRQKRQAALCASGFRDTTRIASGSPEMWRDIAVANRTQLRVALDEFVRELQRVQAILRRGNSDEVLKFFETARRRRDAWCSRCASPSSE